MKRYKCQALVTLYPRDRGGLAAALVCETRRLVVRAEHPETHDSKIFSSVVSANGDRPRRSRDSGVVVTMQVNGDDAREYLVPGEHFVLGFGTDVGQGVVSRRMFV